jgi:uncharacterized protein YjbI with pentapeptide repeats
MPDGNAYDSSRDADLAAGQKVAGQPDRGNGRGRAIPVADALSSLAGRDVRGTSLREFDLRGRDLRGANLRGADLSGRDLRKADLRGADLLYANLAGANLSGANLQGALVTDEQLAKAASLDGATMPDGTRR